MAGGILGVYGMQRSGKTLISYKIVKSICKDYYAQTGKQMRVYTNLYTPWDADWTYVNSMDALPLDLEPKIVLIDEIYNGCDAQDYRKLKDISIFINTLGKQNCLFIFTSIDPNMVYNRIRNQMNVVCLVKSDTTTIHYKFVDLKTLRESDFCVEKNADLFQDVFYDTNFIPLDFDWSMGRWKEKLQQFYMDTYGMQVDL